MFKHFQDHFLSKDERGNMFLGGIQNDNLNRIRSDARNKPLTREATETKLHAFNSSKHRIRQDHQILSDYGVFYSRALYHDVAFELTLSLGSTVVKGTDRTQRSWFASWKIFSSNTK